MIVKIEKILKAEPNITAKDVAKKLGCKKGELNPILYANQDKFVVDSDYRWRLKGEGVMVTFDGNGWVNCDSFETTLQNADGDLGDATKVTFILPKNCYFLLDALARLLAFCNQLAFRKVDVTIDFSNDSELKHYLNRAGFFDHLNENINVLPQRPTNSTAASRKRQSENLVELGIVTPHDDEDAKDDLVKRLTAIFLSLTSDKYKSAVSTIFAELTGNIQDHSETKLNGFAGLQKYGKYRGQSPHIQTVVSDSGVGIATSLRPSLQTHYKTLHDKYYKTSIENDIALVTEVMSKGLISRYGSGRGLGFQTSRDSALKFKAKYSVRQENFSAEFIFENEQLRPPIEKKLIEAVRLERGEVFWLKC